MYIHIDNQQQSLTKQNLTTLSLYNFVQVNKTSTHKCSHIIDLVVVRPDDDTYKKPTVTDSLEAVLKRRTSSMTFWALF